MKSEFFHLFSLLCPAGGGLAVSSPSSSTVQSTGRWRPRPLHALPSGGSLLWRFLWNDDGLVWGCLSLTGLALDGIVKAGLSLVLPPYAEGLLSFLCSPAWLISSSSSSQILMAFAAATGGGGGGVRVALDGVSDRRRSRDDGNLRLLETLVCRHGGDCDDVLKQLPWSAKSHEVTSLQLLPLVVLSPP